MQVDHSWDFLNRNKAAFTTGCSAMMENFVNSYEEQQQLNVDCNS